MNTEMLKVTAKGRVELVNEALPALGTQDVLAKTSKSLVSPGTERAFILNLKNTSANYPFKSGYAACCVVEAVGSEVTRFAPGDRVTGFGIAHQGYGIAHEDQLCKVPDGVDDEEGAFGALGLISMQGVRKARLELGESCVVIGMGPIGQIALQIAKAAGAYPVVAVDIVQSRLDMATRCGADAALNSNEPGYAEQLKSVLGAGGACAVIECTGFPAAVQSALDCAGPMGRVVLLGSTRGDCTINVYRDIHKKGLCVIGAHLITVPQRDVSPGRFPHREDLDCFLSLVARKKVNLKPLITHRCEKDGIIRLYNEQVLTWNTDMMGAIINWNAYAQPKAGI